MSLSKFQTKFQGTKFVVLKEVNMCQDSFLIKIKNKTYLTFDLFAKT